MSSDTTYPDAEANRPPEPDLSESASALVDYLDSRLREEGSFYEKSRFIAKELPLSSKEIGALIPRIQEEVPHIEIERWGYTNGTTWRISRP